MVSWRILFPFLALPLTFAATMVACGDDAASPLPTGDGGTGSSSSGSSSGGNPSSSGNPGDPDGGPSNCDETPAPPDLEGDGPCKTLPFGKPAAPFEQPDSGDNAYDDDAGVLPPGIYDAVLTESQLSGGSWRETFVAGDDGRFTRIRQIDPGNGANEITYRSGTFTIDGNSLVLTADCFDGDAATDQPRKIPFELVRECGSTSFRTGAAGTRATLKRR